jgi:hypothetical protein
MGGVRLRGSDPGHVAARDEPRRAPTVSPPQIGQTVTHYRVLEKLGVVYEAEDTRLGRRATL